MVCFINYLYFEKEIYIFQNETRINRDGYFIIFSDETRHCLLNQAQCLDRIRALIRDASVVPKGLSDEERKTIEQRYNYF